LAIILLSQVRGHVRAEQGHLLIDTPIGNELTTKQDGEVAVNRGPYTASDIPNRMCTDKSPHCANPKNAKTVLVLLEHGCYGDQPVSKVLLIPHTGIDDRARFPVTIK
jgi:hypothetical protein